MGFWDEIRWCKFNGKHPAESEECREYRTKPDLNWMSYGFSYPKGYFKLDVDDYDHKTGEIVEAIHGEPRSDFILKKLMDEGITPVYFITPHGKHFIFKIPHGYEIDGNKQNWISYINIKCEWKIPESKDHFPVVINGNRRQLINGDKEPPVAPIWVMFLQKRRDESKYTFDMNFPKGDRTNKLGGFYLYLISKKSVPSVEAKRIIEFMNESFDEPIPNKKLYAEILNDSTLEKGLQMEEQVKNSHLSPDVFKNMLNKFGASIKYNELTNQVEYINFPDWNLSDIQNVMPIQLMHEFRSFTGKQNITKQQVTDLIVLEADKNSYNPVKDYLSSAQWDGLDRFPMIFDALGVTDAFEQKLIKYWFYQTARLPFNNLTEPFQSEGVLILQGDEGIGKTRFFQQMGVNQLWFSSLDKELNTHNKDVLISMTSVWIAEIGEIDRTFKANKSDIKSFMTSRDDTIRRPYRPEQVKKARTTSYCGTTNKVTFLNDDSGFRRWWVVDINQRIDLTGFLVGDNLRQFWSQCYQMCIDNPDCFRLTVEDMKELRLRNREATEMLPAEEELRDSMHFNAPESMWSWVSLSEVKNSFGYGVMRYDTRQIGKALMLISKDVRAIKNKRTKTSRLWYLPPAKR